MMQKGVLAQFWNKNQLILLTNVAYACCQLDLSSSSSHGIAQENLDYPLAGPSIVDI